MNFELPPKERIYLRELAKKQAEYAARLRLLEG
jgi:hypothetical protein